MPGSTPAIKVEGVRRHGGEVVLAGAVRSLEQQARAEAIEREEGLVMIPPFDHPDVVAGRAPAASSWWSSDPTWTRCWCR